MTCRRYIVFYLLAAALAVCFGGSTPDDAPLALAPGSSGEGMSAGAEQNSTEAETEPPPEDPDYIVIAHALGGIDDHVYLNCREGFLAAYDKGCRQFEVDLTRTSDLKWVCRHSWTDPLGQWEGSSESRLTYEEFLSRPLQGRYTPMSLEDLFRLLKDYPDVRVYLDSKHYSIRNYRNTLQDYTDFVQTAQDAGVPEVLDRLIPEIYNEAMFPAVSMVYPFPSFVYSIWEEKTPDEMEEIALFCQESGIDTVTINVRQWNQDIQEVFERRDIRVYLYTVNDPEEAARYIREGVSGIITDWVS